ncbi:hypothetical protein SUBVAR_04400 [Subdoligranulum variabile DSM 15176]|uniref:Uncharacterized protein n=1 Tax=Subdoligranulum variabile DSM 15176 TaxID=411471 RepID=D1PJ80_9FIRM|nr:hypothetical protein SUBVAR_04400 [Subdoligranulum variabile DSM 15176]
MCFSFSFGILAHNNTGYIILHFPAAGKMGTPPLPQFSPDTV